MEDQNQFFRRYLGQLGLRLTKERQAILDEIFAAHDHFEAEELLLRLKKRKHRVSRATIYRTLELLVDAGLVRKVSLAGAGLAPSLGPRGAYFEHVWGHEHHDHLVCTACGRIIEFSNGVLEELQEQICRTHGFKPHSHSLKIMGLCRKCQAK